MICNVLPLLGAAWRIKCRLFSRPCLRQKSPGAPPTEALSADFEVIAIYITFTHPPFILNHITSQEQHMGASTSGGHVDICLNYFNMSMAYSFVCKSTRHDIAKHLLQLGTAFVHDGCLRGWRSGR